MPEVSEEQMPLAQRMATNMVRRFRFDRWPNWMRQLYFCQDILNLRLLVPVVEFIVLNNMLPVLEYLRVLNPYGRRITNYYYPMLVRVAETVSYMSMQNSQVLVSWSLERGMFVNTNMEPGEYLHFIPDATSAELRSTIQLHHSLGVSDIINIYGA